ncbi:SURF1 family protein [Agreia sp. COWG]|uniref:SURF1 family cytochrome oxidase biogenesis protein n=1 Tax=Agreia sp. COWG TaxID=2773266 RepID=UPI001F41B8F0|nr:SURF1 family protein [Agreia sp. COWG]
MSDEPQAGAETGTGTDRRTDLAKRSSGELASRTARYGGPVAVYDTATEGMTGWRFLHTRRWYGYIAAAIVFAIACVLLSNWQFGRAQEATAENKIVASNFSAEPVPLETALPTRGSFDANQNWQRVTVTGVYRADDELVVRNRSNSGTNGFEVLTPLQLSDGSAFLIDRGWVAPSASDALKPGSIPKPAAGTVEVVAQLRPSEAASGTGVVTDKQLSSVTLPVVERQIDADLYTGAYGVLRSQTPAADKGLEPIETTMPVLDVGTHYSYGFQWLVFALIGFVALGYGMVKAFRSINEDDPEEQERASTRLTKRARKAFTDEETEDESIDGYIPLARWGISSGTGSRAAAPPRAISPQSRPLSPQSHAATPQSRPAVDDGAKPAEPPAQPAVYVIRPREEPSEDRDRTD